jgi:hypothetical protein
VYVAVDVDAGLMVDAPMRVAALAQPLSMPALSVVAAEDPLHFAVWAGDVDAVAGVADGPQVGQPGLKVRELADELGHEGIP